MNRCGDVHVYRPKQIDDHLSVVETPATEFMLEIISVKKGETAKIPTLSVPRILIGFNGVGSIHTVSDMEVKYLREGEIRNRRGSILFQSANVDATLTATEDVVIYATHERVN